MQQDRYQPTASSGNQSWNKIAWTVVVLALIVIVAVAISAGQDKQPTPTKKPVASSDRPTTTPDARTAMTRATFYTTWNKSSEAQRDGLCFELKAYGKAKTAAALKQGAGGSNNLDWNLAADLMAIECGKR